MGTATHTPWSKMTASAKTVVLFAISTGLAIVLLVLGCALDNQWIMMANLVPVFFAAIPSLLSACRPSRSSKRGMIDPFASPLSRAPPIRWDSFGRFFTGSMWLTSFALPVVLRRSGMVNDVLLGLAMGSAALFLVPIVLFESMRTPAAQPFGGF